jgi:chromosomal replication initiator protein
MMEATSLSSPGGALIRASRIEAIQQHVARKFSLRVEELNQKSTTRVVAVPRQIAMYLAKQMTDASLMEIGRCFGGKHHTTVMHSIAKIDEQRRTDPAMDLAISMLLRTLDQD